MSSIRSLSFLPLAIGLVLGGCAGDSVDADQETSNLGSGESEVNAATPITVANYVNHPKIKAIRTEVTEIDRLQLTRKDNPGCDGTMSKFTEAGDKIRKMYSIGGEAYFSGETTAYYRSNGKLLFLLDRDTEDPESGEGEPKVTERRVYFDDNDQILWQVIREASAANPIDREPAGEEIRGVYSERNPEEWFKERGCPEE